MPEKTDVWDEKLFLAQLVTSTAAYLQQKVEKVCRYCTGYPRHVLQAISMITNETT